MEAVKSVWMEQWDYWAVCLTKNCNVCVGVLSVQTEWISLSMSTNVLNMWKANPGNSWPTKARLKVFYVASCDLSTDPVVVDQVYF